MRKLYNEFFYIPKYGKIREKVMLARVAMTVVIMVVCLAAMSITAYAYFSHNVTSASNTIQVANFEAQITVTSTERNGGTVNPSSTTGKKTVFTFADTGTYTVELEKGNNSTAKTGFCIIYIGDKTYHTQQIGVDINANNEQRDLVSFALKINEPNAVVTIESHWGTSSYYGFNIDENYIVNSNPTREIVIGNPVNGASNSDEEKENTSDEKTKTETTPTEVMHTVAANETLSAIAANYGVSVNQIVAYNEINDPNNIQVGQVLKIPPVDYEVPADNTEQTTTTPETTTPPETTVPSESTETTETTSTPETSVSTENTEPAVTTETTSTEGTQPAEETTGAPTTEASE